MLSSWVPEELSGLHARTTAGQKSNLAMAHQQEREHNTFRIGVLHVSDYEMSIVVVVAVVLEKDPFLSV